jgi:hypothetical protein
METEGNHRRMNKKIKKGREKERKEAEIKQERM